MWNMLGTRHTLQFDGNFTCNILQSRLLLVIIVIAYPASRNGKSINPHAPTVAL
jgi:hypothetical protein